MLAGSGDDSLYAGTGADSLVGGSGHDTYVFGLNVQGDVTINSADRFERHARLLAVRRGHQS